MKADWHEWIELSDVVKVYNHNQNGVAFLTSLQTPTPKPKAKERECCIKLMKNRIQPTTAFGKPQKFPRAICFYSKFL